MLAFRVTQCLDCRTVLPWPPNGTQFKRCPPCAKIRDAKVNQERYHRLFANGGGHNVAKYGLTAAAYAALLELQGGVCAICGRPETIVDTRRGIVRRLCVDHDHTTNRVRGLLCHRCNVNLGYWEPFADKAAAYLRQT